MNLLVITHLLNGLLMVGMPVALAIWLQRRYKLGYRLWAVGAATFVLSQVGHIPFNAGVGLLFERGILPAPDPSWKMIFNCVFLGLSAGLWEEGARYAMYRWWIKDARSWSKGVMVGAGHGGIEAIILGALVLFTFAQMIALRSADLTSLVPADQLELAQQQITAYWSSPWYETLLGAVERFFTLIVQISFSLLVLQAFIRRQVRWLWLAVLSHALVDGLVVYIAGVWGIYAAEGVAGAFALAALAIIAALWSPEPQEPQEEQPPAPQLPVPEGIEVEETVENLENSRYS